jgi:hypothetical protein
MVKVHPPFGALDRTVRREDYYFVESGATFFDEKSNVVQSMAA